MKLLTEISLQEYPFRIDHRMPLLLTGSCFTENIGRLLERTLFPACINPFGTTFNPISVMKGLQALIHKEAYREEDLEHHDGLWLSFDHYTGFSAPDKEACLNRINETFLEAKQFLGEARMVVITWGTSWVYRTRASGRAVSNCHKLPASYFTRIRLTVNEIIDAYKAFLPSLFGHNPELRVLLTVSPVRHWKDGARGNQLSKASLLLATEALEEAFPDRVFYFPSYEIVMDELRDYRYYAPDMLHTTRQTNDYIWERFVEALVTDESKQIIRELEPLLRLTEHRPKDPDGEAHEQMRRQLASRVAGLKEKYPFLGWDKLGGNM